MPHPSNPKYQEELESRLENLRDVTLLCEQLEVEDALNSGDLEEAEILIEDLELERF